MNFRIFLYSSIFEIYIHRSTVWNTDCERYRRRHRLCAHVRVVVWRHSQTKRWHKRLNWTQKPGIVIFRYWFKSLSCVTPVRFEDVSEWSVEKAACICLLFCEGPRGCAVGWGTALQVGRSLVRFPMVLLEFFIDNHSGRTMTLGSTQLVTE